jgi:hypothetical protein
MVEFAFIATGDRITAMRHEHPNARPATEESKKALQRALRKFRHIAAAQPATWPVFRDANPIDYPEAKQVRDATEGIGIEAMLQGLLTIAKEVGASDEVKARFEPQIRDAADRFDTTKQAPREMRTAVAGLTTERLAADGQQLATLLAQQLTSAECTQLRKRNKALEDLVRTLKPVEFQLEQAAKRTPL